MFFIILLTSICPLQYAMCYRKWEKRSKLMKNFTANSLFTIDGASWTKEKLKLMIFPSL